MKMQLVLLFSLLTVCPKLSPKDVDSYRSEATQPSLITSNSSCEEIQLKNNFSSYYFKNLTANYGRNDKGSCTYVALGRMLSFMDTYWDDAVIPETYDVPTVLHDDQFSLDLESPGIYQEPALASLNNQEYYNFIEQHSGSYFQLKLIQRGKEIFHQYKFDQTESPCGLTLNELLDLSQYYIKNNNLSSKFSVKYEINNPKQFAINMIQKGIPVEIRCGNTTGSGHAMVAYDYNSATDTIYVHPGWVGSSTHMSLQDTGYTQFWDATAITSSGSHSCTNNYLFTKNYYRHTHCPCESSIHPKGFPNHSHHFTKIKPDGENKSYHIASCTCGVWKYESHYFSNRYRSNGHTYAYCSKCGKTLIYS